MQPNRFKYFGKYRQSYTLQNVVLIFSLYANHLQHNKKIQNPPHIQIRLRGFIVLYFKSISALFIFSYNLF